MRGLRSKGKRRSVFNLLRQRKYDVICLQESYVTKDVSEVGNGVESLFSMSMKVHPIVLVR